MVETFIKVGLIVVIILLVVIIGALSGYVVKVEPATTTTTLITTQPTTTISITTMTPPITPTKTIAILGASCDENNYITLIIENIGNTRIEKDDIKIYINDIYKGTFGKTIELRDTNAGTIRGVSGTNEVKVVSPINVVEVPVYCSGTKIDCSKAVLTIIDATCNSTAVTVAIGNLGSIELTNPNLYVRFTDGSSSTWATSDTISSGETLIGEKTISTIIGKTFDYVSVTALCGGATGITIEKSNINDFC